MGLAEAIGKAWRRLAGTDAALGPDEVPWRDGLDPATVVRRAHEPIQIVFRRMDASDASESVCFPDFGIVATLTAFAATAVDVGVRPAGRYEFCSPDGDIRGLLVVMP